MATRRGRSRKIGSALASVRAPQGGPDGAGQGLRRGWRACADGLDRGGGDEQQLAVVEGFGLGGPGAAVGEAEFAEQATR